MRVYVPFGKQWFPYFMRRLGERPANVGFVVKGILERQGLTLGARGSGLGARGSGLGARRILGAMLGEDQSRRSIERD